MSFVLLPVLALVFVACFATLVVAVVLALAGPPAGDVDARWVRWARNRVRVRAAAAVLAAAVTGVVVVVVGLVRPDLVGLPYALAPGLGLTVGLLTHAVLPVSGASHRGPTVASLTPRRPWDYGSRAAFGVPAVLVALTVVVLLVTGLTSDVDEAGRHRELTLVSGPITGSAGPYPGWWYGGPLLLVTGLLLVSAAVALHRIAVVPSLPRPDLDELDQAWRRTATQVVTRLTTTALLGYLGGVLFYAGSAAHRVAAGAGLNGATGLSGELGLGIVVLSVGVLSVLASVVVLVSAIGAAVVWSPRSSAVPAGAAR